MRKSFDPISEAQLILDGITIQLSQSLPISLVFNELLC